MNSCRNSWKKSTRLIETSRKEIILALARATQTYASTILQGDTSMLFTEVMEYFLAQQKRLNPHSWVSDLKQQGEPPQYEQGEQEEK
jgi:hypothetical protein